MKDEHKQLASEVATYCRDADQLDRCGDWIELETWLVESATEPWHEYENLLPLQNRFGDDIESAKSILLIEYIANNVARRYIAWRNSLEYERLNKERASGVIDREKFDTDSKELARMHARLYEYLDL